MSRTLIRVCKDGNIDAVKEMIANGADIYMIDDYSYTPLYMTSE